MQIRVIKNVGFLRSDAYEAFSDYYDSAVLTMHELRIYFILEQVVL